MANLDAVFDFMFTEPKFSDGVRAHTTRNSSFLLLLFLFLCVYLSLTKNKTRLKTPKVDKNEPLYFCDVCAGPGGFSEYVLWRKKSTAKGFGMTLKEGDNDFRLEDFVAGSAECFEPFYGTNRLFLKFYLIVGSPLVAHSSRRHSLLSIGVNGVDGDGDVTRSENLKEFQKFVVDQTGHRGVHFMMADGGFSVEGNENIQEILSKQLYLCQFLCALSVLRTGISDNCSTNTFFFQYFIILYI